MRCHDSSWAYHNPDAGRAENVYAECGLRSIGESLIRILPGQYYDAERGTNYNYYRDYDSTIGRYEQSDLVGLRGGLNTYSYVKGMPLSAADPDGLSVQLCCRLINDKPHLLGPVLRIRHCFLVVDGIAIGLYPEPGVGGGSQIGVPGPGDPRDAGGVCENCKPKNPCTSPEDCVRKAWGEYPIGGYETLGPNSNTFAYAVFSSCCQAPTLMGLWSTPGYLAPPPAPMP